MQGITRKITLNETSRGGTIQTHYTLTLQSLDLTMRILIMLLPFAHAFPDTGHKTKNTNTPIKTHTISSKIISIWAPRSIETECGKFVKLKIV